MAAMTTMTARTTAGIGMFAFLSAPDNTLDCDDIACEKSEWDMISFALVMYKV
jgi:hypothetical protein